MTHLTQAELVQLALHYTGNKAVGGKFFCSPEPAELPGELKERLCAYYLDKFNGIEERYRFYHPTSLQFNLVHHFVSAAFEQPEEFHNISKEIATHLFDKSVHPNIKPGELHIALFRNCMYNGEETDALGMFKTEDKAGFFEIGETARSLSLNYREGIDIKKFEKGCIIFNTAPETGFEVMVVDKQNRLDDTRYWMDDFLGLISISNEFSQTSELLSITRNYITRQFTEDFEVSKTDQIDLLNRSIDYFKTHDAFDKQEFEQEVFHHPEMIRSFQQFDNQYREQHALEIDDQFDISIPAVKKQARVFKSVLKLDRNFHIYIHGNKEMIEKGVEKDGRKYYKIYYENET